MSKNIITKTDSEYSEYSKDTQVIGKPEYIYIAKNTEDVKKIIKECYSNNTPLTFSASRTSMTGASTTNEGIIVNIKKINKIIEFSKFQNKNVVTVQPGIISSDLQSTVANSGFYYPPVPTSKDESAIGGNVATNAFGEDSFKYGPVRKYVRRLKVILAIGKEITLERKETEVGSIELGHAGYFENWKNPIDLFIGSEGTLGFISEITLELLPREKPIFMILLPFDTNLLAISKIMEIVNEKHSDLRALEFIDHGACENLIKADGFPNTQIHSYLYLKIEYNNLTDSLNNWTAHLKTHNSNAIIAKTESEIDQMIKWRQHIPKQNKEIKEKCEAKGGAKISGDWWVPVKNLYEMMKFFYDGAKNIDCFYIAYAHLGQGHPHTSFFTNNPEQTSLAKNFQIECCKKAVSLGGGVAGEHGIGKIYKHLVPIQHDKETIAKFIKWKMEYDSKNIFGRGNIIDINDDKPTT